VDKDHGGFLPLIAVLNEFGDGWHFRLVGKSQSLGTEELDQSKEWL
jgi:hypothetical protein